MVENFGSYLKHERELRGVPLEEIAEVTKVHIRFLEALENNDFDQLPGEVFIKGYIRSYAKVIGLDSEEMVTAYDENVGKDRKQELEDAHLESEKIHSRKKNLAGYVIGGIGLAGILVMGYLGVGSLVEEGNKEGAEQLSASDPTSNAVEPEKLPQDDAGIEEKSEQELETEVAQEVPVASPVDEKSKPEARVETARTPEPAQTASKRSQPQVEKTKPGATDSNLKEKPASSPEAKKPKPEIPVQILPKPPQQEVEKTKPVVADSKLQMEPSSPSVEKKVQPETSEKPAETEKPSDLPEEPVIIQYVAEGPKEGDSNSEAVETDSKRLHLMIQAQGNSWFNVTVDDGGEDDFILPGGSNKNIYGNEKFRVTIGNRRGTQIFLNGQSIDLPFGTSDVIRDFEITAKLIE
jgi:cytoskeletal protein RodZ